MSDRNGLEERDAELETADIHAVPPKPIRTRASSFWVGLIAGIVALVVILVFILENLHDVHATFFGVHWDIPLGIDLLLAAILGGAVVFVAGTTRIVQLRMLARRQHHALERHHVK
jgi:uncharacterized integral membrane protein